MYLIYMLSFAFSFSPVNAQYPLSRMSFTSETFPLLRAKVFLFAAEKCRLLADAFLKLFSYICWREWSWSYIPSPWTSSQIPWSRLLLQGTSEGHPHPAPPRGSVTALQFHILCPRLSPPFPALPNTSTPSFLRLFPDKLLFAALWETVFNTRLEEGLQTIPCLCPCYSIFSIHSQREPVKTKSLVLVCCSCCNQVQ